MDRLRGAHSACCHNRHQLAARTCLVTLLVGMSLLAATACGQAATPQPSTPEDMVISGPAELLPVVREAADSFVVGRPEVRLSVNVMSAAEALAALRQATTSVAVVAFLETASQTSFKLTEIARQPISVIVHADNPVKAISLYELGNIYSGRSTDWSQAGGLSMPILVLSREASASLRLRMDSALIGADGRLTPNALLLPSDEAMIATVARRPEAIGYVSGLVSASGVKVLTVEGEQPSAIAHGRPYPLWQPIILVTTSPPSPAVSALLSYVKGRQGQRIVAAWRYGQGGNAP